MDAAVADTPMDRLSRELAPEMAAVNDLIRERMASRHAPRIPEVTAHLVDGSGVQAGITAEVFEEAPEAVNESLGSM